MSSYVFRPLLATRPTIRWAILRDIPAILRIDAERHGAASWTYDEYLAITRKRNVIAMTAERGGQIVGFMVYEFNRRSIELINFGVLPDARRHGVGRALVSKLIGKLTTARTAITLTVRETDDQAVYFFAAQGFRATGVIRGYFEDTGEDGYRMVLDATRGLGAA
jgi:ribosomal-protein-alanine N-acetyltransferase